jgi:hypothetical protein
MRHELALVVVVSVLALFLGAGAYTRLSVTSNNHYKVSGDVATLLEIGAGQQKDKTNADEPAPVASPQAVPPAPTPASSPEPASEGMLVNNITDLWISERSGKPYYISEDDGKIEMFEDGANHQKVSVGRGKRFNKQVTLQFHSTLDQVDGFLKLELSPDGKSLDGYFRGLDPTKEGRVRLLRAH